MRGRGVPGGRAGLWLGVGGPASRRRVGEEATRPDGTRKVPGAQPARSKVPGQVVPDGTLIEGLLRCPTNYPVLRAGCKVPSAQGKVPGHVIPDATLKVSC